MNNIELQSLIASGWDEYNRLTTIKDSIKDNPQVSKILQDLTDAYLIYLGRLGPQAKEDKDSFVIINKTSDGCVEDGNEKVIAFNDQATAKTVTDVFDDEVASMSHDSIIHTRPEVEPKQATTVDDNWSAFDMEFDAPIGEKLTDFDLYGIQPEVKDADNNRSKLKGLAHSRAEAVPEVVSEDAMWNCDFAEPVGEKLTDDDIYPETKD